MSYSVVQQLCGVEMLLCSVRVCYYVIAIKTMKLRVGLVAVAV